MYNWNIKFIVDILIPVLRCISLYMLAVSLYTVSVKASEEVSEIEDVMPPRLAITSPDVEIVEHNGVYHINATIVIRAPAASVRYVLTDYDHIYRLNPSIIESEVVTRTDDSVRVRTRVLGCAAFFCEELDRVESVRILPTGDLYAEIIPQQSEFKSGHTIWRINSSGDNCEVSYQSNIEPDFYIPPIVGDYLLKESIRKEVAVSFYNLEKISVILAEREWQEDYRPVFSVRTANDDPCISYTQSNDPMGKILVHDDK